MKVIFLDIDGVLNNLYSGIRRKKPRDDFDDDKMQILKKLYAASGAKIVLISSWRFDMSIDNVFKKYGMEIFDRVPRSPDSFRPDEIGMFMELHEGEIEGYVILDDESTGYSEEQMNHAIITKENFDQDVRAEYSYFEGLREKHIDWALAILNKQ